MRSVLVTGATTPIGDALVRRLLRGGTEHVLAVGIEPLGIVDVPRGATYIQADLTRSRDVRKLLFGPARALEVEGLVHAAMHRLARESDEHIHTLNVEATRELLHLAERHPTIRRFVLRSFAEVYLVDGRVPVVVDEEQPLDLSASAPQWVRDRVEADLTVCARMGLSPTLEIAVVRTAQCLAPDVGSQLFDYLQSAVCLRPVGYDPMIEIATIDDIVEALALALDSSRQGVFNAPGADVLPLSELVRRAGRASIPVPDAILEPLYGLRARALGADFRYDMNRGRLHFSALLDGRRARADLGYEPCHPIEWPLTRAA